MSLSSTNSLAEVEFDHEIWRRLQQKLLARVELEDACERYNQEISNGCNPNQEVLIIASEIEHKRCLIEQYKNGVKDVQRISIRRQRALRETVAKLETEGAKMRVLKEDIEKDGLRLEEEKKELAKKKRMLFIFQELCTHRKIFLVNEIKDVFKIEIEGMQARAQKPQKCACGISVSIRGYHLPDISSWPAHDDSETTAAIDHTVHLLQTLSKTLDYPFRYPLKHKDVGPVLVVPIDGKKQMPLSGWRRRVDKEKFYQAIQLLGKDVAQLRSDTGIHTLVTNNILLILSEWIYALSAGNCQTHYNRPKSSISSLASLISEIEQDNMYLLANSM